MITVIARWEDSQMPPEVEWQLWRQLRGAFDIKRLIFTSIAPGMENYHLEQYQTIEEALAVVEGTRVFLEPTGSKGMFDIPQNDIVLITGNTSQDNLIYAKPDETYAIKSKTRTHLYPSEATAIALAVRHGQ